MRRTSTAVLQRTLALRVPPSASAASPKLSPGLSVPSGISSPSAFDLQSARAAMRQQIKGIGRIVLPHDDIAELEMLFLQERLERGEMFLRQEFESGRAPQDIEILRLHSCTRSMDAGVAQYVALPVPRNADARVKLSIRSCTAGSSPCGSVFLVTR